MKKQRLFGILATTCLGFTMALGVSLNIIQTGIHEVGASQEYVARQVFQMNRIRYNSGQPNGIQSRWQDASFPVNIWDMSYGRVVLNAASTGNYMIGLRYAADAYPVKVFVNGVATDYDFPDNDWANTVYDVPVSLNEGKNVFIAAILNWGVINGLVLPDGVTLVDEDTSEGVYSAGHSDLQNTYLSYIGGGVHDPDAFVYTSELNYDGSSDWRSIAKFGVTASANTKSLEVTYYCKQYTDGISKLQMSINSQPGFDFNVYEPVESNHDTITIPTATLTANGFTTGINTIEIIKPENDLEKIGLISLSLKDDLATWSTTRIEAEDYASKSGGSVGDSGNGNWSGGEYMGDMGTKTTLSGSSEISTDLSNVNYLSYSYIANTTGIYELFIRYATETNSIAHLRVNQRSWIDVDLLNSTWWDNPRVVHITANMVTGANTITLTGTTNNGGWVNYDFIDVIGKGTLTDYQVAYNYAVYFREQTSAGCTAQNVSLIPWNQLKSEYLPIPSGAKQEFVESDNEVIADARARYEVLINKYSTLAADNWLVDGDNLVVFSAQSNFEIGEMLNQNVFIIVGLLLVTFSIIGLAFLAIKKRKINY